MHSKDKNGAQQLQRIWAFGLMKSWFCIWDNLLRLFAIVRVANPKIRLNLYTHHLKSIKP
ncbi:hypothetical protein DR980_14995 [Flavobacterium psychrolimnae]|uniref:Uncharacterized protein n=1 Tax=Flavobacterium psychrolimnae TaxID=249351 RepID=A0A366AWC9_9FLAO|nr:hypothetical protein DR980_14995 [Flavobacterium psychrolimnae]